MADEYKEYLRNYELCFIAITTLKTKARRAFVPCGGSGNRSVEGVLITKGLAERSTLLSYDYLLEHGTPIIPAMGYYNIDVPGMRPTAVFVSVPPARQYRKALDGGSVASVHLVHNGSPLFAAEWNNNFVHKTSWSLSAASRLLAYQLALKSERTFGSYAEALRKVESGEVHAMAISKFFTITLFNNCRLPCLLYRNTLAGLIKGNVIGVNDTVYPLKDFFSKKWNVDLVTYKEFTA